MSAESLPHSPPTDTDETRPCRSCMATGYVLEDVAYCPETGELVQTAVICPICRCARRVYLYQQRKVSGR